MAALRSPLGKLAQKHLRFFQILRVEAFGEPVVDGRKQVARFLALALAFPQAGEAGGGAELPGLRLLLARPGESGATFSCERIGPTKQSPIIATLSPPCPFDMLDRHINGLES